MRFMANETHMKAAIMLQRAMLGREAFPTCCEKDLLGWLRLTNPYEISALKSFDVLVSSGIYLEARPRVCRAIWLEAGC